VIESDRYLIDRIVINSVPSRIKHGPEDQSDYNFKRKSHLKKYYGESPESSVLAVSSEFRVLDLRTSLF